jgi:hypothetical protein
MAKNRPRNRKDHSRSAGPKGSAAKASARDRSFQVLRDMERNPSLAFTKAARNREVDPRTVQKHVRSGLQKDSSGRIKVRPNDRLRQTLFIPGTDPGEEIPVPTSSSHERRLLGKWMAALNYAGRGDFSRIRAFPRGQSIGGVSLPTSDYEIQRILDALAEAESPFEGLYRTIAGPS